MEAQEYIDKIAERRGFVLDFHKVMAQHDFPVLVATDDLTKATMISERALDLRTKELLVIVALAALRGSREDLATHIRLSLAIGVSPAEILQALEILLPMGGVILFKEALDVWREATGSTGLEPSTASVGAGAG